MTALLNKIASKDAHVVVMGIGYVGLPLVAEFARAGFRVTGLDRDARKVESLQAGRSYIEDVPSSDLEPYVQNKRLSATTDFAVLAKADAVIVCVPTPLNKTKDPDMQYIVAATEEIAAHQHGDMVVVLESTTYPGTTNEVLVPRLTSDQYQVGRDVFIAFSPERVDPGNKIYKTRNTPKVIGGATPQCLEVSPEAAEMVKLLENTFRAVNIGLVNEVAMMSRRLGIDPFEVIRAAATKPFGFMPFYPGPGLGGHCIPIDPLYLSWKLRSLKYEARFIDLADSINSAMPSYVVQRVASALNESKQAVNGAKLLVYGMAYKANVSDVRESPALAIVHELQQLGAQVDYMDPYVSDVDEDGVQLHGVDTESSFENWDAVVLVTNHDALDRRRLLQQAKLIIDTRDALRDVPGDRSKVYGL
jgi:UDP-N-acetyl-D-glucosamine dehydrogenase